MGLERLHHKHQRSIHTLLVVGMFQIIIPRSHAPGNKLQLGRIFAQLPFDCQRDACCYRNAEQYAHQSQSSPGNPRLPGHILRFCRSGLTALHVVLHQLVKISCKTDKICPAAGEQCYGRVCFPLPREANYFFARFFLCLQLGHNIGPQLGIHWFAILFARLYQGLVGLCVVGKLLEGALDAVAVFGNGYLVSMRGKGRQI